MTDAIWTRLDMDRPTKSHIDVASQCADAG